MPWQQNKGYQRRKARLGKRELREQLMRRQRGRCYYCKCQMVIATKAEYMSTPPLNAVTLEHMIDKLNPLRGVYQHYVAACWKCNNERANRNPLAEALSAISSPARKIPRQAEHGTGGIPDTGLRETCEAQAGSGGS